MAVDRCYRFARRGTKVPVVHPGGRQVDAFVTGDSAKCQHAHLKHFGLGKQENLECLEIRRPDGQVQRLDSPGINRYHQLTPGQR
ncbi:MAG: ASPIC/UnbV domain-containing protein [Planctomycetota bacterium]